MAIGGDKSSYIKNLPHLTDHELSLEWRAVDSIIDRSSKGSGGERSRKDLTAIQRAISLEMRGRGLLISSNPCGGRRDKTLDSFIDKSNQARRRAIRVAASPSSSMSAISKAKKESDEAEAKLIVYAEVAQVHPMDLAHAVSRSYKRNPTKTTSKSRGKKNSKPKRRVSVDRCRSLWSAYQRTGTKKSLKAVLMHLDKMKTSESKSVKSERSACLRIANREAKSLGLRLK